jgi:hypothetical protein
MERPPGTHYSSIPTFQHSNSDGFCETKPNVGGMGYIEKGYARGSGGCRREPSVQNKAKSGRDGASGERWNDGSGRLEPTIPVFQCSNPGVLQHSSIPTRTDCAEQSQLEGSLMFEVSSKGARHETICAKQTQFRSGPPVTNKANLQGPGTGGQEGDGGSCETKPICLGRKTDPAEPGRTMVPGFPLPDRVEDKLRGNDIAGHCAKQSQFGVSQQAHRQASLAAATRSVARDGARNKANGYGSFKSASRPSASWPGGTKNTCSES